VKRTITTLLLIAAIMAVFFSVPAVKHASAALQVVHAQEAESACSLTSLKGSYALDRQGTLVSSILGLPAPAPWGEIAFEHFDGAGAFSGKATVNVGGAVVSGTVMGTYTINSDCTGTKTVNTSVGVTVHEAITLTGGGQRMIGTQTDPWAVVQTRAEKIGD
jgi:hypothetical protein